ncbi:MAG: ATP-binding cassette domain-containing protein [Thaumarchaeota archaeon]|jgi:energy-coupling factor transport system ATP-binding protein|nr:ATP-binding cassette domain-containing protein [Candidatus Geocrenenecus arthurdayi]
MEAVGCLEVRNLNCRFDSKWILRSVSFEIKPGEALAIIGPSASGKTTLAYCLSGIIPNRIPGEVSGSVRVDGEEFLGKPIRERTKTISIVLQNYELQIFGLTVEEDLELSIKDNDESTLEWILRFFELEKYRDYYVHELSGGLKHRLVIASAILSDPKYIVMDDPVANLDWKSKKITARTIELLKERGKGVVILGRRLKGLEKVIDRWIYLAQDCLENVNQKLNHPTVENRKTVLNTTEDFIIEFRNVYYKYSREYVLKNISLRIRKGEVYAVMGPNGSGKTTLMKHVNGLLKPFRGSVIVKDMDTKKYSPAEMSRYVGMVFQDPEKYFVSETVWDEVAFGVRNLIGSEENVEKALRMVNLLDKKKSSPYSLSMGEKLRLYIACVLAMSPEIVILDEPTTGQDEETLKQIKDAIEKLKDMGRTVIVVTHDSDFVFSVADRLTILKDGTIYAEGNPLQLLSNPSLIEGAEIEPLSILSGEKCLSR